VEGDDRVLGESAAQAHGEVLRIGGVAGEGEDEGVSLLPLERRQVDALQARAVGASSVSRSAPAGSGPGGPTSQAGKSIRDWPK
jgi:hypothetical protein